MEAKLIATRQQANKAQANLQNQNDKLSKNIEDLNHQITILKNRGGQNQEEIQELMKEKKNLEQRRDEQQTQIAGLEVAQNNLSEHNDQLQLQVTTLAEELASKDDEIASKNEELDIQRFQPVKFGTNDPLINFAEELSRIKHQYKNDLMDYLQDYLRKNYPDLNIEQNFQDKDDQFNGPFIGKEWYNKRKEEYLDEQELEEDNLYIDGIKDWGFESEYESVSESESESESDSE